MARETIKRIMAAMVVLLATSAVAAAYTPLGGYRIYSEAVAMGDDGAATVTLLLDNSEAIKRAFHVEVVAPEGYYFKATNGSRATAQGGIGTIDQSYDFDNRLLRLLFTAPDVVPAGTGRAIATLRLAVDPESEAATPGRVMTMRNFTFVRATGAGGHNGVDASVTVTPSAASIGLTFTKPSVTANLTYAQVSFTASREAGLSAGRCGVYIDDVFHVGRVVSTSATTCTVQCDSIGGLMPGTTYKVTPSFTYADIDFTGTEGSFTTKDISFSSITSSPQMTYAAISFFINRDTSLELDKCGVIIGEDFHAGKIVSTTATQYKIQCDSIGALTPGDTYRYNACVEFNGKQFLSSQYSFSTAGVSFSDKSTSTQTSITWAFIVTRDAGFIIEAQGITYNSTDRNGTIKDKDINGGSNYYIECGNRSGLSPNTSYSVNYWVKYKGNIYSKWFTVKTKSVGTSTTRVLGPTTARLDASYSAGDARVRDAYFTFNGNKSRNLRLTGLKPDSSYSATYTIETDTGNQSESLSFKTDALTLTTQAARMLTNSSPMFIATTNIADEETSCGFEWRRYDAPAEMPSATVYCPVYSGTMAGTLKNMAENVYYMFRPFYKAGDGTMYYGDWLAFITADANVEFAPVVYTYSSPEVTMTGATLSGVALRGSSKITSQGFEYWRVGGGSHAERRAPSSGVTRVTASGERMKATVSDLSPATTYRFRSFVEAGGVTTYGDEVEFTTDRPSYDVNVDGKVDVGDVNAVLGDILGGGKTATYDVNGDDRVDVGDVNAILADILAK